MAGTNPCATEKDRWTEAVRRARGNESRIGSLDRQINNAITQMRSKGRPPAEIAWANEMAQMETSAQARQPYHQRMALAFEMNGNVHAARLRRLAVERAGAVERREELSNSQAVAEEAYRACLGLLAQVTKEQQRCGQPRTGRGSEGEPCRRPLGPAATCPYHGIAIA